MKGLILTACLAAILYADSSAQTESAVQVEELVRTTTSWDGEALPDYADGRPEITVLKVTIPPGGQLSLHKHPVINAGVLLAGQLTVVTEDNDTLHVKAGEAIVEVVGEWHYGRNDGSEPAEIVVFYAGIKDRSITVSQKD